MTVKEAYDLLHRLMLDGRAYSQLMTHTSKNYFMAIDNLHAGLLIDADDLPEPNEHLE